MAAPPFIDMVKPAKELFEKNFHFGCVRLATRMPVVADKVAGTLVCSGMQSFNLYDNKSLAEWLCHYTNDNLVIKSKIVSDSTFHTQVETKTDKYSIIVDGICNPKESRKSGGLGMVYRDHGFNFECSSISDARLKADGIAVKTNAVLK